MKNTRYKILLIEDDKLDQMAFMREVKDKNLPYDYTVVGSVSEAKSILNSESFDLILADYMLGDGTAFDIIDLVKNMPIIIVTGAGDEEIAVKAWRKGAFDYLIKDLQRNYLKILPIAVENTIKYKKTEEKLRLLSQAITSTGDSIYITDLENNIIFVNTAFCETYGYKEEEIVGKNGNILYTDANNTNRPVSGWDTGVWHRRKDGTEFPVSLLTSIIKDENGHDIAQLGVARDISELIFVEDTLKAINLELMLGNRRIR